MSNEQLVRVLFAGADPQDPADKFQKATGIQG
jgi:hypothetical protein